MKIALSRKQQYKDFFLSKSASLNIQPAYTYSPTLFLERSFSVFSLKESLCQNVCKCITAAPEERSELWFRSSVCILLFLPFLRLPADQLFKGVFILCPILHKGIKGFLHIRTWNLLKKEDNLSPSSLSPCCWSFTPGSCYNSVFT